MKSKEKKDEKMSEEDIRNEIRALAKRADESSNHQMDLFTNQKLGDEDIDIGFGSQILMDTPNPEESYKLYYGIRRLLIDFLPKGETNKDLRQKIYDEKNLFLNRGKDKNINGIRGSDGRMTYIPKFLNDAYMAVEEWVRTGANPYDIWQKFRDLNENRGFHKDIR